MIYALGQVSGGHFNPAVSLAFGLLKELDWSTVMLYWIAQVAGGISAAMWYFALFDLSATLRPTFPTFLACVAELFFTFMLVFVVLSCTVSKMNNPAHDPNQFYGLAIGFVLIAGGYAAGGISGAIFNPAAAIGIASFDPASWGLCVLYVAIELLAAVLAVGAFWVVHRLSERSEEVSLLSKCVSEWLGTFSLVLTVGLQLVVNDYTKAKWWAAAAALMCMIYSLAPISGANLNPAVTVAVMLRGKLPVQDALAYILTQFVAGGCAGVLFEVFHLNGGAQKDAKITFPANDGKATPLAGAMAEMLFTFVLAFVVVAVATARPMVSKTRHSNFAAFAIGSAVTAGGFAIGLISGGELNPALSLGILLQDIADQAIKGGASPAYGRCSLYMFAELVGGVLAGAFYFVAYLHEYHEEKGLSVHGEPSSSPEAA